MIVENIPPEQYEELLIVWENSVRATHDFITEEDIGFFKPIILEQAFPAVILNASKANMVKFWGLWECMKTKLKCFLFQMMREGKALAKNCYSLPLSNWMPLKWM